MNNPWPVKFCFNPPTLNFDEYVDGEIFEKEFLNLLNKDTPIILDFTKTYVMVVAWMKLIDKLAAQQTVIIRNLDPELVEIAERCKLTNLLSSLENKE